MLFEEPTEAFGRQSEAFYNPKITKVEVIVEGIPNQLFAQGMRPYQMWNEVRKLMAGGSKQQPEVAMVAKDLGLHACDLAKYLSEEFAHDESLHGSGRRIENASEGITIQISKEVEGQSALNVYLYVVMDAQLNIKNGRFVEAIF